MRQSKFWLRVTGTAILVHTILISLSVFEVFIYSYFIEPGKDEKFYEQHAPITAPWVSAIFGSLFMFLLVRRYIKRNSAKYLTYALALPLIYILIDAAIIVGGNFDMSGHMLEITVTNGVKLLSALTAYYIYSRKPKHE